MVDLIACQSAHPRRTPLHRSVRPCRVTLIIPGHWQRRGRPARSIYNEYTAKPASTMRSRRRGRGTPGSIPRSIWPTSTGRAGGAVVPTAVRGTLRQSAGDVALRAGGGDLTELQRKRPSAVLGVTAGRDNAFVSRTRTIRAADGVARREICRHSITR